MNRYAVAFICCLITAAPNIGAAQEELFLMVAGSDAGKPYKIIHGTCFFQMNPKLINSSTAGMLSSAFLEAGKTLKSYSQKIGADALVNMTVTPLLIPDSGNPRDLLTNGGVYVCGTLVKFSQQTRSKRQLY